MDMKSRKQYLQTLLERYLKARKRQKGSILDEFCRNTGQNRKYVIRKLGGLALSEPRPPCKRAPHYGQETARALEKLWKMFDYPCGQRLRPLIETELDRLRRLKEINDNAFINGQLYDYTQEQHLGFSRSRPYRKNDNPHIEQKNFTHVRKPLGYLRYDTPEELALIQDLCRHELRLYKNFFQPVMMLSRKVRIAGRPKRTYGPAKTPYHRLIESGQLSPETTRELKALYLSLNPAELKRQIDWKLARLYDLYRRKKTLITVDPYKKQVPSMVTFLVSEQSELWLPD